MSVVNQTIVTEFILLAFGDLHQFRILLFIFVLLIYMTCVSGNVIIYLLIKLDASLHTPMYYFISVFVILEIIFVSTFVPKLLDILIAGGNRISFAACFLQLFCAVAVGEAECFLLTVMAFDRHLAITNPLHYFGIMSQACTKLALFPWISSIVSSSILTISTASLEYCGPNKINHFFCELAPLQKLSCSDSYASSMATSVAGVVGLLVPFSVIIGFYIHIIIKVLAIKTECGKQKAFSTCSSHLIVSGLFFCTAMTVYINPSNRHYDKYMAFIYLVIVPVLNPFIYTLRNKDVKNAFIKLLGKKQKQ
ncbi:olfactory receptor 5P76-like [Engystomops pustulosus]|uniref:olfactory receptor 5P76-like n=1 Tax=Engystomops pustulosus TaxID=76066 RepID=UPI003AFA5CBB